MSWALYLHYDEADFTEFVASFSDVETARVAKLKLEQELADEEYDVPFVILVEEP
jgi:hypothetical protein